MKSGTKPFFKNVKKEIENIKIHFTDEEKSKLDFKYLNPAMDGRCIYGQATSNCQSDRAIELIRLCCKTEDSFDYITADFTSGNKPRDTGKYGTFSYLEICIYQFPQFNESIIDYIKGDLETFDFKL